MNTAVLIASCIVGIIAWVIILERMTRFSITREDSRTFAPLVADLLRANKIDEAIELCDNSDTSHLAKIIGDGLKSLKSDIGRDTPAAVVKRMERSMTRTAELETAKLKMRLPYLEVIGTTSPVLAFIYSHQTAFYLALLVTAPSVGYGIVARSHIARCQTEMTVAQSELTDFAERMLGISPEATKPPSHPPTSRGPSRSVRKSKTPPSS
jgi:hypothetical protein